MRKIHIYAIGVAFLSGCETFEPEAQEGPRSYINAHSPWQKTLDKAILDIKEGNTEEASREINLALQNNPNNSALHLLNGLLYEQMAHEGTGDQKELALIAYQNAVNLDSGNWYAYYLAGRLKLANGVYPEAQNLFAKSLMLHPEYPEALYSLAVASYYAQDLEVAQMSISKLLNQSSDPKPLYLRAAAVIFAASGDKEKATSYFLKLKNVVGEKDPDIKEVEVRMKRWLSIYEKELLESATGKKASATKQDSCTQKNQPTEESTKQTENPIVLFDCYLLNVREKVTSKKGINVFSFQQNIALSLSPKSSNYSFSFAQDGNTATVNSQKTTSKAIAWNAIQYNLNIMNVADQKVEVLGRPTLSTFLKEQAFFSSGNTLSSGISGGSGGTLAVIPTGIILSVMPTRIEGDQVTFDVELESSLIGTTDKEKSISAQVLDIFKTKMQTTLQLKFNETGMIGGVYERVSQYDKDGFPILSDIPIIQLITSGEKKTDNKNSALFLVTPRRPQKFDSEIHKVLSLKKQRSSLPSLRDWIRKETGGKNYAHLTAPLNLILADLAPRNAAEYFRRGDLLPIDVQGDETSFQKSVAPLMSFFF